MEMPARGNTMKTKKSPLLFLFCLSLWVHFVALILIEIPKPVATPLVANEAASQPVYVDSLPLDPNSVVQTEEAEQQQEPAPGAVTYRSDRDQTVQHNQRARSIGAFQAAPKELSLKDLLATDKELGLDIALVLRPNSPVSSTDDLLPDAHLGDRTLLNTKKYLHFNYIQRVKTLLRSSWLQEVNDSVERLRRDKKDSGPSIATTVLRVSLDEKGIVTKVRTERSSGLSVFDEAAHSAFFRARSFPNPPKALIDANKEVQLRWTFVLHLENLTTRRPAATKRATRTL